MKLSAKVIGLDKLAQNIKSLSEQTRKRIAPAMTNAAAQVVKKAAARNAPVSDEPHEIDGVQIEPGNLKRNVIAVKVRANKTRLTAEHLATVRGGTKGKFASRYGSMKEHGTVKMAAHPWMRPAFDTNISNCIEAMKTTGAKKLVDAVVKGRK